jgi:hypothetical protein
VSPNHADTTASTAAAAAARDGMTVLRDPLSKRLWTGLVNLGASVATQKANAVRALTVAFGRGDHWPGGAAALVLVLQQDGMLRVWDLHRVVCLAASPLTADSTGVVAVALAAAKLPHNNNSTTVGDPLLHLAVAMASSTPQVGAPAWCLSSLYVYGRDGLSTRLPHLTPLLLVRRPPCRTPIHALSLTPTLTQKRGHTCGTTQEVSDGGAEEDDDSTGVCQLALYALMPVVEKAGAHPKALSVQRTGLVPLGEGGVRSLQASDGRAWALLAAGGGGGGTLCR